MESRVSPRDSKLKDAKKWSGAMIRPEFQSLAQLNLFFESFALLTYTFAQIREESGTTVA